MELTLNSDTFLIIKLLITTYAKRFLVFISMPLNRSSVVTEDVPAVRKDLQGYRGRHLQRFPGKIFTNELLGFTSEWAQVLLWVNQSQA